MNIWEPTEEKERISFSECEILIEEVPDKNGKLYNKITLNLFPLSGENLITDTYRKFNNPFASKPWDTHVLPPIRQLVADKKIENAPDINRKFVSWKFGTWLSDKKDDVAYWSNRAKTAKENGDLADAAYAAAKIQTDEKGNVCAEKTYIHILDVFENEEAARKASDEFYGVEGQTSGVWDEAKKEAEPPTGFDDKSSAMLFLPEFVRMARGENGKIDRDKLAGLIESNDVLKAHFTLESEEVQDAINDLEQEPPF